MLGIHYGGFSSFRKKYFCLCTSRVLVKELAKFTYENGHNVMDAQEQ